MHWSTDSPTKPSSLPAMLLLGAYHVAHLHFSHASAAGVGVGVCPPPPVQRWRVFRFVLDAPVLRFQ